MLLPSNTFFSPLQSIIIILTVKLRMFEWTNTFITFIRSFVKISKIAVKIKWWTNRHRPWRSDKPNVFLGRWRWTERCACLYKFSVFTNSQLFVVASYVVYTALLYQGSDWTGNLRQWPTWYTLALFYNTFIIILYMFRECRALYNQRDVK